MKPSLLKQIPKQVQKLRLLSAVLLLASLTLSHAGCFFEHDVEPYYGQISTPATQQFRWSDGGLPQTFDPAYAAAPPDTDAVRALFEGLTDYDSRSLLPVPAVAKRWESSDSGRVWTFYLRDDARWSNGDEVTAQDFVRSWERTVRLGDVAPHTDLLINIQGAEKPLPAAARAVPDSLAAIANSAEKKNAGRRSFGAEALSDKVLRVRLRQADMNFPALVAHPVFRPLKLESAERLAKMPAAELLSNGAFTLAKNDGNTVVLERANNYWDRQAVALDTVEFVGARDTEAALTAYRKGQVDAVTNTALEPLAIKLLSPYADFRRATYGALTYYTFNTAHAPFDDVRVREALAIAIDRDRISADELGGATEPAKRFLPQNNGATQVVVSKSEMLEQDAERARQLLAEAGFPNGQGFPVVRLVINRNEQQRAVAQAIVAMWRDVLNVEAELVVKNWEEYEAALKAGEFDVARRGMVMQTTDELTNIRTLFGGSYRAAPTEAEPLTNTQSDSAGPHKNAASLAPTIDTESMALKDLTAMPIYFASSYALVKPYVTGFDSNVLDAPSLKKVRIDTNWKPPANVSGEDAR